MLSLLSSGRGPLQPSGKIAYQDIKVGIPSLLLCIEMALFAVLHIFAYPAKPYNIKRSYNDPLTASGSGYSGDVPHYQGGPFGLKAILDAMNPWDIVKASARGFRWLFVGYRRREGDASYQPAKLGGSTGYTGPTYAANGDSATELGGTYTNTTRGRGDTTATYLGEDDRAGLLNYPQGPGRSDNHSPYRTYTNDEYTPRDDSRLEQGRPGQSAPLTMPDVPHGFDFKPSDLNDEDPGYHPGMGHPPGTALTGADRSSVHPAYRQQQEDPSWNHWAGSSSGAGRAPTYRTQDPHG